ncbi:MAG: undecaprenyl-diphosphate phosphatase [Edaphobacter sp.]
MSIFKIIILAIVQGLAELLPVSSSAHVVVAEKLMGLDASSPQMTLLLVMLHTGTMFAVIVYFWNQWKKTYFSSGDAFKRFFVRLIWASLLTGVIGEVIIKAIEKTTFKGASKAEIELLFGRLDLIAPALAAAGLLILFAGLMEKRRMGAHPKVYGDSVTMRQAGWIGAIQGFCLPFRGFSRSGATISTGMLTGASKERAERFSFALAVVLTPAAIGREALRLVRASHEASAAGAPIDLHANMVTGLLGAFFAFLAGLVALKWLSSWLEEGRWYLFGIYCLVASVAVFGLYRAGY